MSPQELYTQLRRSDTTAQGEFDCVDSTRVNHGEPIDDGARLWAGFAVMAKVHAVTKVIKGRVFKKRA